MNYWMRDCKNLPVSVLNWQDFALFFVLLACMTVVY